MSASKEKRRRQELYANGQLEKNPGEAQQKAHKRKVWIVSTICVLAVVLVTGFFAIFSTGFIERHTTAATVGDHKLSAALYNFYYQDVYQSIASSMGVSGADIDLSQMPYDETGKTYADFIREEVDKTIAQTYAIYDAAVAEGFVLSETDQSYIDLAAENLEANATYYGATSGSAYLTTMYGKGSDVKTYEQYVRIMQTSSSYSAAHGEALSYTDDEISEYYAANKDALDTVSYRSYTCTVPTEAVDADGNAVYDQDAARAQAETIIAGGSEDFFNQQAAALVSEDQKESYANGSATLKSDQLVSAVSGELAAWLFDENRQYGDTTVVPSGETGYTAVYFVDNFAKYDVELVNVRHILMQAADEAGKAEAKTKAEEILATYQAGEQTEEAFAALAKEKSEDEGSKLGGGLMERMRPGQTVETFDAWSFDPARQPGDTGIVESTYGAHVMYFAGPAGNYQQLRILTAMRSRDTNAWAEELGQANPVTTHEAGLKLVKQ